MSKSGIQRLYRAVVSRKFSSAIAAAAKCRFVVLLLTLLFYTQTSCYALTGDDLPSWTDGATKKTITDFVKAVTTDGAADFVPVDQRIAVFDNDGTLWCEMPIYPQVVFVIERVRALSKDHPEWKDNDLFRAAIDGDTKKLSMAGAKGTQELVNVTHSGMTTDQFETIVKDFFASTKHPRFQHQYTDCVFQPMLEVLAYFRKNGFKTYIVSGGGTDFMRPWTERVYGVPPEQVIGSTCGLEYDTSGGKPCIRRLPEITFICEKDKKSIAIERVIGRKPIAAFGNSNGDLQMLEWTASATKKKGLAVLVHHTDAEREYEYGRDSSVGRADRVLDVAARNNWTVIDTKKDWKKIFPFSE